KSRLMEKLFAKFAVFFDHVMENVQTRFRVRDASHERRHGAREKGHRKEELLLAAPEALEGHGVGPEGLQIWIVPNAGLLQDLSSTGGHACGLRAFTHVIFVIFLSY